MKQIAVLDIGKTNLKVALADLERMEEVAVETAPNIVLPGPPWPHFDTAAQRRFLFGALSRIAAKYAIDGISITTHGASAALLDASGALAVEILDYEFNGPDHLRASYDAVRPPFNITGSPALPLGLNLGAQLHYMLSCDPGLSNRVAHVLTLPQYWGYLLTGVMATDVCSLGCHTDLWNPWAKTWSPLVQRLGLSEKMAPPRRPHEVLGRLSPDAQAQLGLPDIPVLVGIHDSNASLLPHLLDRAAPFSVVSTGTWVISMAIGGKPSALRPDRDTLINVNAFGNAVPSARFMGGREFEMIRDGAEGLPTEDETSAVLQNSIMLLPSVVTDCGPFPGQNSEWTTAPASSGQRIAALGFYLALMTAECLEMIGADGPTLVEGPFTRNDLFLSMLAAATKRDVVLSEARTGTAIGAARLFVPKGATKTLAKVVQPDDALAAYAAEWRRLAHMRHATSKP